MRRRNSRPRNRTRNFSNQSDGEMIDLMQLIRRRLRYRPYFMNTFGNRSSGRSPATALEYNVGVENQDRIITTDSDNTSDDFSLNINEHESPSSSLEYIRNESQNQAKTVDSNTTSFNLSSNTDASDQTCSSSHLVVQNTSEDSLITNTPPIIAHLQIYPGSAQEQNSDADDPTIISETNSPSPSIEIMAAGDGYHNNVLELGININRILSDMEGIYQENVGEAGHDDNNAEVRMIMHDEEVEDGHSNELN